MSSIIFMQPLVTTPVVSAMVRFVMPPAAVTGVVFMFLVPAPFAFVTINAVAAMLAVSVTMLMKLRAIRACDDAYDPRDACGTVRHGDGRHNGHAIPDDRGTRTHENLVFFLCTLQDLAY